jgi:hypothetical protein
MPQMAALAHEATLQGGVVCDGGAAANDEIVCNDTVAHGNGGHHIAVDAAVAKAAYAKNIGPVPDADPADVAGVADGNMVADIAGFGSAAGGILVYETVEPGDNIRMMAVHGQNVCGLGAEAVVYLDLPAARFVEHRNLYSVAEAAGPVREDDVYVLDIGVVADFVIGDIVRDVFHKGIIPHRYVVQSGVPDAGMFLETARKGDIGPEATEPDTPGEPDVPDILEGIRIRCFYGAPVVRLAATLHKALYLRSG